MCVMFTGKYAQSFPLYLEMLDYFFSFSQFNIFRAVDKIVCILFIIPRIR